MKKKGTASPRDIWAARQRLLFTLAYPLNREEWESAHAELTQLSRLVEGKLQGGNARYQKVWGDSGVRGSVITGSFSFAIARWLADRFPDDTETDSSHADPESVRIFFRAVLPRTEFESISSGELSLQKRTRLLTDRKNGPGLRWLVQLLDTSPLAERVKESLFHSLQVYIRWHIRHPLYNSSWLRGLEKEPFFHRSFLRNVKLASVCARPLPAPVPLRNPGKERLIDTARCTLAFLYRETEPFTYVAADGITCFELERGLTVALYSMDPGRRLSVESYIGYLALKNGIPVAYGGGWIFGKRCQFGINILPAYRGGESAWLFAQLLRVYRQYYRVEQFVIKPYQFGRNNPEAIRSGAFWFYYKLGFRPVDTELARTAAAEWKQKNTVIHYRCTPAVLKKLTGSPLLFRFSGPGRPLPDAASLSVAVTRMIRERYGANRDTAITGCSKWLRSVLGVKMLPAPDRLARQYFEEWGLLAAGVLRLETWTARDKKAFFKLVQAKTAADERKFIFQLQELHAFWKDLNTMGTRMTRMRRMKTDLKFFVK